MSWHLRPSVLPNRKGVMNHRLWRPLTCAIAVLGCLACRTGAGGSTLYVPYPELLRQAAVSGFYQFQVGLDSTGAPDLHQFRALASPNPGFDLAVKRAVAAWRPRVAAGTRTVEHAILFIVLPYGADSSRACPPERGYTVICRLRPPMIEATVHSSVSH